MMFYFPILEKIADWVKKQGGWAFWVWVLVVGKLGATALSVWQDSGFDTAKPLFAATLLAYLIGIIPVAYMEERRKRKDETTTDKPQ